MAEAEHRSSRIRGKNFTQVERDLLLEFCKKYFTIIENKLTHAKALREKRVCWQMIAKEFNEVQLDNRSADQLRMLYTNMKRKRSSCIPVSATEQHYFATLFKDKPVSNSEPPDDYENPVDSTNSQEIDPIGGSIKTESEYEMDSLDSTEFQVPSSPENIYLERSKRGLSDEEKENEKKKQKLTDFKLAQAQVELQIKKIELEIKEQELQIRKQELQMKRREAEIKERFAT